MEDVEAMVLEVLMKNPNGNYEKIENFLPLNLLWAHHRKISMEKIQPGVFKHLDLAHIIPAKYSSVEGFKADENNIIFIFDTAVKPNTNSHILLPGTYQFKFVFVANNLKPAYKNYEIVIADKWNDSERKMLKENISIKEIKI